MHVWLVCVLHAHTQMYSNWVKCCLCGCSVCPLHAVICIYRVCACSRNDCGSKSLVFHLVSALDTLEEDLM